MTAAMTLFRLHGDDQGLFDGSVNGITIAKGVIRGVESNGMLCSGFELELSEDHDGIIELPADAPVGQRYVDYAGLDEPVIEINLTPNRPDAAGVHGIARDLAAAGLGTLKPLDVTPIKGAYKSPIQWQIASGAEKGCPMVVGRMVRGLRNGPSPRWLHYYSEAARLAFADTAIPTSSRTGADDRRARPKLFDRADICHTAGHCGGTGGKNHSGRPKI